MIVIISAVMVLAAVGLLFQLKGSRTAEPMPDASGLAGLNGGSSNLHDALLQRSRTERVVKPWIKSVNSFIERFGPTSKINQLHDVAATAGIAQKWSPRRILVVRSSAIAIGSLLAFLVFTSVDGLFRYVGAVVLFGIGFRGFDTFLTNRARNRQETITRELPDIADQIAISVHAGLSLEQAIRRTVNSTTGPLSDELARFLHDVRLGIARSAAFRSLQQRVDVQDMTSFVRAIAQAEKTGVSIGDILQMQSEELRERRKQRAEERAMKLPVLMMLPLAFCILPALLIVVLGPAALNIMGDGGI